MLQPLTFFSPNIWVGDDYYFLKIVLPCMDIPINNMLLTFISLLKPCKKRS